MTLASSPGKMDLSALGGLKKRAPLQSVPAAPEVPAEAPETPPEAVVAGDQAPETGAAADAVDDAVAGGVDAAVEAPPGAEAEETVPATADEQPAEVQPAEAPVRVQPAEEEHSGHVTLYLPGDLNKWLAEHHDGTGISYPGIILNAISWAAGENRLGEIFAPVESPIPANDIFGRAPTIPKLARGTVEPETRPIRFRRDHMQVIISLARTWTADNRNAFFVGVLSAYRHDQNNEQESV
ncbi:hypothetical protein [Arthrobacter sp. ES1]|uniref:hypothetical protein n=1 Tax=Arthrobacter sp. ES1 TaxID=1897056 RepID=UPI001CFF736B|nr:hypothetical protein [Arthrobacter sp. ES1]MCB5280318.1 hypothetical protein [Arthrobacter sp. ES1]